jgi:hypothetical protein
MNATDPTGRQTGAQLAEKIDATLTNEKNSTTDACTNGGILGVVCATFTGAAFDATKDLVNTVLRIGENSGDKIGSGASPLTIGLAVGGDLLTAAAIAAPVEGAAKGILSEELSAAAEGGAAAFRGGESAAAKYGREIHAAYDYGPGFEKEVRLPNGLRPDAINRETREVIELKPNTPSAIREGNRQLRAYVRELNRTFPGEPFKGRLITYDRP